MNTIEVTMKRDQVGSSNGISTRLYKAGKTYTISESLAEAFVEDLKVAEYALPSEDREDKKVAPENKADSAPENKSGFGF